MNATIAWLQATLAREYQLDPASLTPEASLESLGIDSLGMMELLFAAEDRFLVTIPHEHSALGNIVDVADYIDRLVLQQHGANAALPPGPATPDGSTGQDS